MRKTTRGRGSTVAVTLLCGLALLLVLQHARQHRDGWPSTLPAEGHSASDRGALKLVFQEADCSDALASLARLGEAARLRGLAVGGVALRDRARAGTVAGRWREYGFSFPVREERGTRVVRELRALGFRATPVILVTDGEGRLRAALPGNLDERRYPATEIIDHAERLLDLAS